MQYTTNFKRGDDTIPIKANYTGNNLKSMRIAVDASLKKLRTAYIDILYIHWWDWGTSVEEVMNGLHNLVLSGKVLYLVRHVVPDVRLSRLHTCFAFLRECPILRHGLWHRRTSTPRTTASRHS